MSEIQGSLERMEGSIWTVDAIRCQYQKFVNQKLAFRLGELLDWVFEKGIFLEHNDKWPNIRVKGKGGYHIVTFMAGLPDKPDGNIYLFFDLKRYPRVEDRRELIEGLAELGLRIDKPKNKDGSYLTKKVQYLEDEKFQALKKLLGKYSG